MAVNTPDHTQGSRSSNAFKDSTVREKHSTECNGNYLGIVVQNDDPSQRGRVKVYVPHISASVYGKWDEAVSDKKFKFIGDNVDSDLTDIIDDLKELLPWAECAAPLVGATGSGRYNARLRTGSISDSGKLKEAVPKDDYVTTKYSLNTDGIGESPARVYETDDLSSLLIELTPTIAIVFDVASASLINSFCEFVIIIYLSI